MSWYNTNNSDNQVNKAKLQHSQFLQELVGALSFEAVFLIEIADFLGHISYVTAQLVVPAASEKGNTVGSVTLKGHEEMFPLVLLLAVTLHYSYGSEENIKRA